MKLGSILAWGWLLAVGTLCPRALAEPALPASTAACDGSKPWVELSSQLPPAFAQAVLAELGAGLAPSSIEVCPSITAPESPPLARLSIRKVEGEAAHFRLNVTDSVTQKSVARELALEALPADGRALALAVAAEELLRASWAELALRGVHTAKNAAPPELRAVRAAPLEPKKPAALSEPRYLALGGRVAFERFSGKQTHYGADLFAVVPAGSLAALLFEAGVRRALAEASPHGSIAASGMSASVGLGLSVWRQGGFDLQPFVSAHVLRLHFDPEAKPDADAQSRTGFVVTGRAGISLAFGARHLLRSYTAVGAGPVLKSLSAADAGRVATAASGLELCASTGLAFELF